MLSLQHFPSELLEHIFSDLDTPQDLLRIALTCKAFYNLIIPTNHLRFAAISFTLVDSPAFSLFWQKLSKSRPLCSRIRQIKFCSYFHFHHSFHGQQFPGFRLNREFITEWADANSQLSPATDTGFTFQDMLQYWGGFNRCQTILVQEPLSRDDYSDLLAYISIHLSERLKTLVIYPEYYDFHNDSVPRYRASNCSFSCLEVFYLHLDLTDDNLAASVEVVLNSLISNCSTLVEFTLRNDWSADFPWSYFRLPEKANWPFLKKLGLTGPLQLFDPSSEERQQVDIYVSFLERHPQLESLHLEMGYSGSDPDIKPFQTPLPPHILPQLRSLNSGFLIHPDIFPRLSHMTNLQVFPPSTYPLARSLRSCILLMDDAKHDVLERLVEAVPQLECLGMHLHQCSSRCTIGDCTCILQYDLSQITKLRHLTHLAVFARLAEDMTDGILKGIITQLPRLSFVYLNGAESALSGQHQIIRNPHNAPSYELRRLGRYSYPNSGWEDFFGLLFYADSWRLA